MSDLRYGFIGGGQMAEAIFAGALAAGALRAAEITVTDIDTGRLEALEKHYGVATVANDAQGAGALALAGGCDVVILAVKPQLAKTALAGLGGALARGQLVISIIGGMTLESLEALLPGAAIIRTMPNTPAMVRRGSTGIAAGSLATAEHLEICKALFGAVGATHVLPERLMDPLTAVSGCGPAFACLFMEALADGGVEQGLPRDVAMKLAAEMLAGTAEMLLQTGRHPAQLKDAVTSPGGSTIAGVRALEDGRFRATVMDAVAAARRRMEELGK